jgi:hypothetical protein
MYNLYITGAKFVIHAFDKFRNTAPSEIGLPFSQFGQTPMFVSL